MCTIFHNWRTPKESLPQPKQRVLVVVKMKYGGNLWTTIAEHVPKHTVIAEDFCDPDCDDDWLDVGQDGKQYTPEGWYESTIESDFSLRLEGEVVYWACLPAKPMC